MNAQFLLISLALLAGSLVPFQTASNTILGKSLNSNFYATIIVFIVAAACIAIMLFVRQEAFPSISQIKEVPLFAWFSGGLLGAVYIFLLVYLAPQLGMATITGFVVAGQLITAIAIDHFGLMNFPVHSLQWQRLGGVLLLCVGLYLIKKF